MTAEDYERRLVLLKKEYEKRKVDLAKEYAMSNNPYKVGDIVQDSMGKIKIEKIKVSVFYGDPCCAYYGVELNRYGKPLKRQTGRAVYQNNII